MPNVALIKSDGQPLVLPAASVVAVIFLDHEPENFPGAKTVIWSTFRNYTPYFLAQESREVLEELVSADERAWLTLSAGDQVLAMQSPIVTLYEGEAGRLRVWMKRPDGADNFALVDGSEDNLAMLNAALFPAATEPPPPAQLAPPKPPRRCRAR